MSAANTALLLFSMGLSNFCWQFTSPTYGFISHGLYLVVIKCRDLSKRIKKTAIIVCIFEHVYIDIGA